MVPTTNMKSTTCFFNTAPCWCSQKNSMNNLSVFPGRAGHPYLSPPTIQSVNWDWSDWKNVRFISLHRNIQMPFHAVVRTAFTLGKFMFGATHPQVPLDRSQPRQILLGVIKEIIAPCYACISLSIRSLFILSATSVRFASTIIAAGSQKLGWNTTLSAQLLRREVSYYTTQGLSVCHRQACSLRTKIWKEI